MRTFKLVPSFAFVLLVGLLGSGCKGDTDTDSGDAGDGDGDAGDGDGDGDAGDGDGDGDAGDGDGDAGDGDSGDGDAADPRYEQARADCVARINAFRATEGLPPLERWEDKEACADTQSEADAKADQGHANFGDCDEFAQNTCPGWGSVDEVIDGCLQSMWDEGPGEPFSEHGHYLNMSSTSYTMVACGFYELPDGSIWSNQNFR